MKKNLAKRSGVDSERRVYSKDKRASRLETPNKIPFWTFLCWKMEEEDGKDGALHDCLDGSCPYKAVKERGNGSAEEEDDEAESPAVVGLLSTTIVVRTRLGNKGGRSRAAWRGREGTRTAELSRIVDHIRKRAQRSKEEKKVLS